MTLSQHSRRNFLSTIAILSAGTAFGSTIKQLPSACEEEDLQKKWDDFWKKSGAQKLNVGRDLEPHNNLCDTKGHLYKNGEAIYFSKENIIAQPTWIFWQNNTLKPADAVITLFENNSSLKKIGRLNRFEINALYKISKQYYDDKLLQAHCNNLKSTPGGQVAFIKNKTSVTKKSQMQQVSYYKEQALVLHKKFIYHS